MPQIAAYYGETCGDTARFWYDRLTTRDSDDYGRTHTDAWKKRLQDWLKVSREWNRESNTAVNRYVRHSRERGITWAI